MFSPMEFFCWLVLIWALGNLGNFFNLHKCKMAAARYVNMCYTRTACANVKCNTSFKGSFVHGIQIYRQFFYFKVLTGDAVGRLSIRHVIKILSEFSNFRVSGPNIMLLFIYSRSMSRSVVVVHFAIGLNKVVSYGVIPHVKGHFIHRLQFY